MGKGDLRTKRGKIHRGTHGKRRPRGTKKKPRARGVAAPETGPR